MRTATISGLFLLLALPVPAVATPVGLRIQDAQLRNLERALRGMPVELQRDLLQTEGYFCMDPVGVQGLDVKTAITDVTLARTAAGRLEATLVIDRIEVRGTAFADTCFGDLTEEMDPLLIEDARVTVTLSVRATPLGALLLEVTNTDTTVGAVSVSGSDLLAEVVEWLAPDLVDTAARAGVAYANGYVEGLRVGSLFGIDYRVSFTGAGVSADGIDLAASLEIGGGEKAACLPADAVSPAAGSAAAAPPTLSSSLAPEAGVLIASAGELPGSALAAAWWAGLFCGEGEVDPPLVLKEAVEALTGRASGAIRVRYALGAQPRVNVQGETVAVALEKVHLEVLDPASTLFLADFDLSIAGRARIESETRLVHGSIDRMSLGFTRLESALADGEVGHEEMRRFLEEDLPAQLVERVQDIPVADAVFKGEGGRTLLEIVLADGDFRAATSPFFDADPAVDSAAPETEVSVHDGVIEMRATDDRDGAVVFSWSVDGGLWSAWSRESRVAVDLPPGLHQVQVIARDRWGNVDETPAVASFELDDARTVGACACSTTDAGTPLGGLAPAGLALVAIALLRRRVRLATAAAALPLAALVAVAPRAARAEDTRVLPPGIFILSATGVHVLHNPPPDVTSSSVDVPTGAFPLGVHARARSHTQMNATLVVPSVVVGIVKGVNVVAFLPVFLEAEVRVKDFQVRAAGVDVTPQAQDELRKAGFKSPSGEEDGEPISTWRGKGIGDLTVLGRWRVFADRESALALSGGAKIPIGRRDDPRILTDFGFSEGQFDIPMDVLAERRLEPVVLGATAGYRLRLPGPFVVRPVGGPTITTTRDPGDVLRAGTWVRGSGAGMPALSFEGTAAVEHHLPDSNRAGLDLPDQRGTALVFGGSVGANNIKWFLKHRFGLPVMINAGMQRSIALNGNRRLEVWQTTARLDLVL